MDGRMDVRVRPTLLLPARPFLFPVDLWEDLKTRRVGSLPFFAVVLRECISAHKEHLRPVALPPLYLLGWSI